MATVSPRGHCTDAILLCCVSSDSLLILRQSGGSKLEPAGTWGCFVGKQKQRGQCQGPGDAQGWRSSLRTGLPNFGQLQCKSQLHYREAPKSGQPHHATCHSTAMGVCVTLCDNGATRHELHWWLHRMRVRAATTETEKFKKFQEKENPTLLEEMLLEAGNNFSPVA